MVAFEAMGAGAVVTVNDPALLAGVSETLPLGATLRRPTPSDRRFGLTVTSDGYAVDDNGEVTETETLGAALAWLGTRLMLHVMLRPKDRLFVHAGVVGVDGGAIVLPGWAGLGKTTLTASLVRAGAIYYTDDYAPVDAGGEVHPFPLELGLRHDSWQGTAYSVESLGGIVGELPLPIRIIAHIRYVAGERLCLEQQTSGRGMLMLLDNALGIDLRPDFALSVSRNAAAGALIYEGVRGEADDAASRLLELASIARPVRVSRHT